MLNTKKYTDSGKTNVTLNDVPNNIDQNFSNALEQLIDTWVTNNQYSISIDKVPNNPKAVTFATNVWTIKDGKGQAGDNQDSYFKQWVDETHNKNEEVKKNGTFSVDLTKKQITFNSPTTSTTEVNWSNYPCVTSNQTKKEIKGNDNSISYEISGVTYFGNGTKKDKSGVTSKYECTDNKTISTGTTNSFSIGSSSSSSSSSSTGSNTSGTHQDGLSYWEGELKGIPTIKTAVNQIGNLNKDDKTKVTENTITHKILNEQILRIKKLMNL
jgi:hypothetical protein